ncbi:4706_t:CDS:2 [Paraglomus occultum]|uniref:4706_t:CDS:1 n=1 Tax=Paraglomus occultum TaxID=144539 RepID=A0A9N8VU26_9GLOM|nr:4706_t:CDS:2 [Paraglomus occultum]
MDVGSVPSRKDTFYYMKEFVDCAYEFRTECNPIKNAFRVRKKYAWSKMSTGITYDREILS